MIARDQLQDLTLQELIALRNDVESLIQRRAKMLGLRKWTTLQQTDVVSPKTPKYSQGSSEAWPFG